MPRLNEIQSPNLDQTEAFQAFWNQINSILSFGTFIPKLRTGCKQPVLSNSVDNAKAQKNTSAQKSVQQGFSRDSSLVPVQSLINKINFFHITSVCFVSRQPHTEITFLFSLHFFLDIQLAEFDLRKNFHFLQNAALLLGLIPVH